MFSIKVLHTVQFLPCPDTNSSGDTSLLSQIFSLLKSINTKNDQFMATVQEQLQGLNQQVADLKAQQTTMQETIDAEQEQIQKLLDAATTTNQELKDHIADLETKVADPAVLDSLKANLNDIITKNQALIDDVKSTVPDEQTGGGDTSGGSTGGDNGSNGGETTTS